MRTAIVTPSYAADFERCRLLCESVDRRLRGDWTHYLLVAPCDLALFRQLEGPRRIVMDERDILPFWLRAVPDPLSRGTRKLWVSPFAKPLRGWHAQQLRKLAFCRHTDAETVVMIDSDVVLVRDFDPASLWRNGRLQLYHHPAGIDADIRSDHLAWLSHADRLLGIGPYTLPAADYISTMIAWRTDTCRALLDYIEARHGQSWIRAMIRNRQFSEYITYGRYVTEVLKGEGHALTSEALCHVIWFSDSVDHTEKGLAEFMEGMSPTQIGLGISSFAGHDLNSIRHLVQAHAA